MKTPKILAVVFSIVIGFAIGLMVGLTLTNPGMSLREAAGTIGRIDQYRNVRVTASDIELRNELLSDEHMREAYRNYLAYEYASNIKMGEDIRFAILAGYDASDFRLKNRRTLNGLEDYAEFLDNARLRILEALTVITDLSDKDRVAIRTVLNNAGNALAQTQFRNGVVFDFMLGVERFFDTTPPAQHPELAKAHDQLFANVLMSTMVNDNRPVLEHLLAKELMDEDGELAQLDMETLRDKLLLDMGELQSIIGLGEASLQALLDNPALLSIGFLDQAGMLQFLQFFDAEQLQHFGILDSEMLQSFEGVLNMNEVLRGSEMMRNSEFLRGQILFDTEQLRGIHPY
ncbi:MAG: hypothetical protein RG741_01545 [Bacteroidales bacterium]|nr:hypothetical protein [Bacteroidales bacterium]